MFTFIYKVLRSFRFASRGILDATRERNMKVHIFMALLVVSAGWYLSLSFGEWSLIAVLIAMVWTAEMFNTCIEELSNIVRDELKLSYAATRRARDIAAGAVLVTASVAAVLGLSIFLPKLIALL